MILILTFVNKLKRQPNSLLVAFLKNGNDARAIEQKDNKSRC